MSHRRGSPAVERRLGGPRSDSLPSLPGDVLGMACLLGGHRVDGIFANVCRLIADSLEEPRDKNQIHVGGDAIHVMRDIKSVSFSANSRFI